MNAVAPGPILTEPLERAGKAGQESAARALPIGRLGCPEEVAATIAWLCGEDASFITGTVVPVDGGKLSGMMPFQRNARG